MDGSQRGRDTADRLLGVHLLDGDDRTFDEFRDQIALRFHEIDDLRAYPYCRSRERCLVLDPPIDAEGSGVTRPVPRLVALMMVEATASRHVPGPIQMCGRPISSLYR